MKYRLFIFLCLLSCCYSCGPDFGTTYGKAYEFLVENKLSEKTVKIVPKSKTDFWISSSESFIVAYGEKTIIGSKVVYDGNKKATDIYRLDENIVFFDVFIDEIKQDKTFSLRKFWDFSLGKVNNGGKYTLIITENILND